MLDQQLALVPDLRAGSVGWCCGIPGQLPIVVASLGNSRDANRSGTIGGTVVATRNVAAVAVDKLDLVSRHPLRFRRERLSAVGKIELHKEPGLPDGLRTASVEIKGSALRSSQPYLTEFVPLNASGKQIPQAKALVSLSTMLPTRVVSDAAHPRSGVCRIDMEPVSGVFAFGAKVITQATPQRNFIAHAFTTCASTVYKIGGWRVEAAVLLDAADPGARPANLPLMKPLPDHSGVFEAWPENNGPVLARRVPGAWLVVGEGRDLAERMLVLEHLRASVHLG